MEHKKSASTGPYTSRTQLHKTNLLILSRGAKLRLKWMDHFAKFRSARLTCRHFGISPDTFYLWRKRFSPDNPATLEDDLCTRKPHKLRVSAKELRHGETIRVLKNAAPGIGKIRIAKILKGTGHDISASTVGRILKANKRLTMGSK
jgi:hypothetical protein